MTKSEVTSDAPRAGSIETRLVVECFPLGSSEYCRSIFENPPLAELRTWSGLELLQKGLDATPAAPLQVPVTMVRRACDELLAADGRYPDVLVAVNVPEAEKLITSLASAEVGNLFADALLLATREPPAAGPVVVRAELQFTSGAVGGSPDGPGSARGASPDRRGLRRGGLAR